MLIMRALVLGLIFCFSTVVSADLLDVSISNDAVSGDYQFDLGQGLFAGVGLLHEEDNGEVASLGLHVADEVRSGSVVFRAGVGGKIFGFDTNEKDGGSLGLGGFAAYQVPSFKALSLGGEVYFGPSVTSFGDIAGMSHVAVKAEIEVIERAMVYLGYRRVVAKVELDDSNDSTKNETMDEGVHLGIRLEF